MSSDPTAKGARKVVRIGKYEVVAHVATGGMGAIYRARDTESGREVALKVLTPEMAAKPAMVERFRREGRAAAKLCHENIVAVHEFAEQGSTYYLVMEFVDGIDLHEYVNRKGPLPPAEALAIVIQACRALEHAHERCIVHRDVKPANFLVVTRPGPPLVKLTDLGLAREETVEQFRVTRAGTTVGTVDYMAPEQARDSGLADVRSDLYSLAATWFYLLTAQPLFPRGGLGERLLKIMSEDAPDVRTVNPRVPAATAAVIRRLLSKDPGDRYQTPRDLLDDLDRLQRGQEPQATQVIPLEEGVRGQKPEIRDQRSEIRGRKGFRASPTPETTVAPRTDVEALPPKGKRPRRTGSDRKAHKRKAAGNRRWWYAGAAGALLLAGIGLALALRPHRQPRIEDVPVADGSGPPALTPPPQPVAPVVVEPGKQTSGESNHELKTPVPAGPRWRRLYQPDKPIQPAELRKEVEAPWAKSVPPAGESAVLTVGRGAAYSSLAAACSAAPAGRPCVVEIRDNGPFCDIAAAVVDRALTIRAARGFRPLLVWDVTRTLDERRRAGGAEDGKPLSFLDVRGGSLSLENVDLVLKWPESAPAGAVTLLRVQDGDLSVAGCTISVSGGPPAGLTLARFASTRPEPARCRFTRCYIRGPGLAMLDMDAPGAEVLFDGCLMVGGELPTVQVRAAHDRPPTLRVVRSTIVAGRTFLRVQPARPTDLAPALNCFGWDALLCRSGVQPGGDLMSLPAEASPEKMTWRAVNCLYAGWQNLLTGKETIAGTAISPWRLQWERIEGDDAVAARWPPVALLGAGLAELPAASFRPTPDLPVAAAASAAPDQPLGCALEDLPATRDNWLALACGPFVPAVLTQPEDPIVPEVPAPGDGRYHGGSLDLDQTDLGAFLKQVGNRLGPRVVLHLSGTGERPTSPVRLSGHHLVLYFTPPAKEAKPLVLTPAEGASGDALVEVENGTLEVMGGTLRLSDDRGPAWLLAVRGGDVRLSDCRLEGPQRTTGGTFRGLVRFRGSGDPAPERLRSCLIQKSVLTSGKDGILLDGLGAGLRLRQSLLVVGGTGVQAAPGPAFKGRANLQCVLDHTTVAAREAVLRLGDCPTPTPPAEPVVVQTHSCAFLNPFPPRAARTGLVLYEGDALAHGLLVWQGEHDFFDHRLHFGAAGVGQAAPEKPAVLAAWTQLWGTPNVRSPGPEVNLFRTLDAFPWALERLVLPPACSSCGANLGALGISKKPA